MTSTDLVQTTTVLSNDQLQYISRTEFVPAGLRGNLPAILACVATGRALGLDDMTAIRSINVIDGKPSFSAELMVLLVRRAGHSIQGDLGEGYAQAAGKRADNGDTMSVKWTMKMAERAGLASKQNWKKYPESMLWARAVSQLCRMLFADCFAAGTYTSEELGDEDAPGEPPDGEPHITETATLAEPDAHSAAADPSGSVSVEDDGLFPPVDHPEPGPLKDREPAMYKKLNLLVGTLRTAGHITTEQLWRRVRPGQEWPRDMDGELHWAPLRDSLSKDEASALVSRLEKLQQRVSAPDFAARAAEAIANREVLEEVEVVDAQGNSIPF